MVRLHVPGGSDPVAFVVCVAEGAVMVTREDHRVTVFESGRVLSESHPAGSDAECWVPVARPDGASVRLALAVRALLLPNLPPLPGQPVLMRAGVG
jgi:hypothetical protein